MRVQKLIFLFRVLVFFFIFLGVFSVFTSKAFAETHISGNIDTDTTWTVEGSPYIIDNSISVSNSASLSIEPGVIVKFAPFADIEMDDAGSLQALGTADNKIYFTSLEDDEIGGDTNADGEATTPDISDSSSSIWYGLSVSDSFDNSVSHVSLQNVVVRYADAGLSFCRIADVTIGDSVFENNREGIKDCGQSHVTISNTKVINNNIGIHVKQTDAVPNSIYTTSGLSIYGNAQYGVQNETHLAPPLTYNWRSPFLWFENLFKPDEILAEDEEIPADPVYNYNLDFKNTWWGDKSGPFNSDTNHSGLGNKVSDDVAFSPWCTNELCTSEPKHNPVIIVPGVLGTEISNSSGKLWLDLEHNLTDIGDEFMDPLQFNSDLTPSDTSLTLGDVIGKITFLKVPFDYTGSLLEEFTNQGYVQGTDLFLFPYDWRYGVSEDTVAQLKQKITDVLATSGAGKVDIVAHSTGGLLVKKYVVENSTDNHIDKAVFVGVPNTGAPKAVKALVQGDEFGNFLVAYSEMQKISQNMPVAYDLSPSQQYFNAKGSYVKIIDYRPLTGVPRDLNFDEANNFLTADHQLNSQALTNAHTLHTAGFDNYDLRTAGVDLYAIDGCKAGTIGKFVENRYHTIFGNNYSSRYQVEDVSGDGTVPLESSTNLPINDANKYYALKGEHSDLLSEDGARQQIVNIISGSTLPTKDVITQDISKCELKGRAISIYSPLSIDVMDQDGNHSGFSSDGVSIENHIPNADFEILGEHKFVYLPTDAGQTYAIKVNGTGIGTFTLTDASIDANDITGMQVFKNIAVTPSLLGHLNIADNTTLSLDTNGDGVIDQTLFPNALLNAEDAQNFVPDLEEANNSPENNTIVAYGSSGRGSYPQDISSPVVVAESPRVEPENIPKVATSKPKIEIAQAPQAQNPPKENTLTANAIDTGAQINYKILILVFSGMLVILLLAKNFIKV